MSLPTPDDALRDRMRIRELEAQVASMRKTLEETHAALIKAEAERDGAVELLSQAPLGGGDAQVLLFVTRRKSLLERIGAGK